MEQPTTQKKARAILDSSRTTNKQKGERNWRTALDTYPAHTRYLEPFLAVASSEAQSDNHYSLPASLPPSQRLVRQCDPQLPKLTN